MIETLAVSGYRSLRNLVLPLDRLNVVTGANGSGKSSLYRALRLLGDAAMNSVQPPQTNTLSVYLPQSRGPQPPVFRLLAAA